MLLLHLSHSHTALTVCVWSLAYARTRTRARAQAIKMKLWQQHVRKQYKEMQDEIYTLLQERREQVVLEDYRKPEQIKHLELFEYQVKHLTTFKEVPENVEITMRKEAAVDEADEEEKGGPPHGPPPSQGSLFAV